MKFSLYLILLVMLVPAFAPSVLAEDSEAKPDAAQTAGDLRLKLIDLQAKEAELQARARQLEESMKPENIERSFAGVGSTKPEELRESRRRQLSIELDGVRKQLGLLSSNRERLEAAIRNADNLAYQQSAEGPILPAAQVLKAEPPSTARGYFVAAGVIGLLGLVAIVAIIRRLKTA